MVVQEATVPIGTITAVAVVVEVEVGVFLQ